MPTKKSDNLKTANENIKEIEPLIYNAISDLLSRPGKDHSKRDWIKNPLTQDEHIFIIQTLYKDLEDPNLPAGLLFLYGRIIDWIKEKTLYN